jgi:predicted amidophosphoribosyltransferase
MTRSLIAALADLVLPQDCAGCEAPGSLLCAHCTAAFGSGARRVSPTPCPAGLPPCWATTDYDGPVRAALLAYKEADRRALVPVLGSALARAVSGAVTGASGLPGGSGPSGVQRPGPELSPPGAVEPGSRGARPGAVEPGSRTAPPGAVEPGHVPREAIVLVPVPSTPAAVRARGGDHVLRLARAAVGELRRAGWDVRVERLLGAARPRRDSAGLDAAARQENLAGAFRTRGLGPTRGAPTPGAPTPGGPVRGGPVRGGPTRSGPLRVVLVDDLITTGATLAEAASALRAAGVGPTVAAVVAATARRDRPLRPDHGVSSGSTRGLTNRG